MKINLFGTYWKIEYVNVLRDENGNEIMGWCDVTHKAIQIALTYNGQLLEDEEIRISLFHEIIHAILMAGQYNNESMNEPMVEWIARCFNQMHKDKQIISNLATSENKLPF